jgi:hypothetical protein
MTQLEELYLETLKAALRLIKTGFNYRAKVLIEDVIRSTEPSERGATAEGDEGVIQDDISAWRKDGDL